MQVHGVPLARADARRAVQREQAAQPDPEQAGQARAATAGVPGAVFTRQAPTGHVARVAETIFVGELHQGG